MNLIAIDQIVEGMTLAEDIINEEGVIYLNTGTELKGRHIRLLENLNVTFVYVVVDKPSSEAGIDLPVKAVKSFNKEFKHTLETFKNIYTKVRFGSRIAIDEVKKSLEPLVEGILNDNDILGSLRSIEINDEYTFKHSINVSLISSMIGKWMGYDEEKLKLLSVAGLLHDLGKCKVPSEILNKPSRLEDNEFEIMKTHALLGFSILTESGNDNLDILKGILQHHERIDGNGYPNGLRGDAIHEFARIIAVADIFDAMTTDRCYRAKLSAFEVAEELSRLSYDHLDVKIVTLFIQNISKFFVGNRVLLNTGDIGEVIMVNPFAITRPLIKLTSDFIDLSKDYRLQIVEVKS
ncbi:MULTISPECIES: HD-GYP domain-containing protein [unclassified Fusibacter]|uniref:HD-GYP domain-containing protein n=1 Tax=unclassified Fusibacter TaxID=2624464 RepID=UPI001013125B|nr:MULTISPECIES: HD-GYP domain-containing protein [unclassified Fusibacter]MCK8061282.1 HD-GYP domain-containing protein [Fusibacter sp. A2]NPE23520.1 HD-GYP domain-containing protein [Fusibacter sp. A1]RXV59124.1 HD-GYP domain-containing protein [Fusibacter sp. A1]